MLHRKESIMLVLSRKASEVIHIGDQIRVMIVRIGPNSVRVGIEAPEDMAIVRDELLPDSPSALTPIPELTEAR